MAKRRHRKSSSAGHHSVSKPKYAGKSYDCYGKHVRAGRSKKKIARVFCAKAA